MIKIIDLVFLFILYKILELNIIGKIIKVILPFIFAFVLAYILYPIQKKLNNYLPKPISIIIIILIIGFILCIFILKLTPLLYKQIYNLINLIIIYLTSLADKYNINITNLVNYLTKPKLDNYLLNGITLSINVITNICIFIISFIYFLIDMNKFETKIKNINNKKTYNYLSKINKELKLYLNSITKICIISFIEYLISFSLIHHPSSLLMALVSSLSNIIPVIGSFFILLIGVITSPQQIVIISLMYFILSLVDSYLINPLVFNKNNKIHPLINIVSVIIGNLLFGFIGLIFALPIVIIINTTYLFFKDDLYKLLKKLTKLS